MQKWNPEKWEIIPRHPYAEAVNRECGTTEWFVAVCKPTQRMVLCWKYRANADGVMYFQEFKGWDVGSQPTLSVGYVASHYKGRAHHAAKMEREFALWEHQQRSLERQRMEASADRAKHLRAKGDRMGLRGDAEFEDAVRVYANGNGWIPLTAQEKERKNETKRELMEAGATKYA